MDNLKLIHQLFIGKVVDEIGMDKTTELLKEAKEAFAIHSVVKQSELLKCQHDWVSIGHQGNGHQECKKCKLQKAF